MSRNSVLPLTVVGLLEGVVGFAMASTSAVELLAPLLAAWVVLALALLRLGDRTWPTATG